MEIFYTDYAHPPKEHNTFFLPPPPPKPALVSPASASAASLSLMDRAFIPASGSRNLELSYNTSVGYRSSIDSRTLLDYAGLVNNNIPAKSKSFD